MDSIKRKELKQMKIDRCFVFSRVEKELMASAYELLVPIRRRRVDSMGQPIPPGIIGIGNSVMMGGR